MIPTANDEDDTVNNRRCPEREESALREMQTFMEVPRKLDSVTGRKVVASRHDDVLQRLVGCGYISVSDPSTERLY